MGDAACFLQGLALGAQWLEADRVEACLVIGAEETDWLLADALWHLEHAAVISGGAGALCLSSGAGNVAGRRTEPHHGRLHLHHFQEPQASRAGHAPTTAGRVLRLNCFATGMSGSPRADAPEAAAWRDWTGPHLSPKRDSGRRADGRPRLADAWPPATPWPGDNAARPMSAWWGRISIGASGRGSARCQIASSFATCRVQAEDGRSSMSTHEASRVILHHRRQRRLGGHRHGANVPAGVARQPPLARRPQSA